MRWLDKKGRPLPLDEVFEERLGQVRQRLGGVTSRLLQKRRRRQTEDEQAVLMVRSAEGTKVFEGGP